MKKISIYFLLLFLGLFTIITIILSTKGIETKRFNKLISQKIVETNSNIDLNFNKILIKLDIKNLSIFVSTDKPLIFINKIQFPVKEIRAYVEVKSIIKNNLTIKNVYIDMDYLSYKKLKKLIVNTKPSNFKSLILNNVQNGEIKARLDINFDEFFKVKDYQVDGHVKNLITKITKEIKLENTDFIFSLNKNKGLFESINGKINDITFSQSKINFEIDKNIFLSASIKNTLNLDEKNSRKYAPIIPSFILSNKFNLNGNLTNELTLTLDKTFKIIDYNLKINGLIKDSFIDLSKPIQNSILDKNIKKIFFNKTNINFSQSNQGSKVLNLNGKYKINNDFLEFKVSNQISKKKNNINLDVIIDEGVNIPVINYNKNPSKIGNLKIQFEIFKKYFFFKKIDYKEGANKINVRNLKLSKKKLVSIDELSVYTLNGEKVNNDFKLSLKNNLIIKGKNYDSKNLNRIFNNSNNNTLFSNTNAEVKISFDKITTKLSKQLENFNLIGKIQRGKFVKINAKGDFNNKEHIDISLKKDSKSEKKYLEIYSDIPEVLLADYDFFQGLSGGKLLFSSIFEKDLSSSKLIIEDFKVINAPGFIRLLSIADYGGMVDLLSGKGLSFDKLELNFSKDNQGLKLNELFAVGSSVSILMEGYVESKSGLISLRGTMIPAKNLNKFLSKIPVVGKIIIPKEIGEGLFGVSFKIKGLPKQTKTSVNPLKTLTPRFITKALEKSKSKAQ